MIQFQISGAPPCARGGEEGEREGAMSATLMKKLELNSRDFRNVSDTDWFPLLYARSTFSRCTAGLAS